MKKISKLFFTIAITFIFSNLCFATNKQNPSTNINQNISAALSRLKLSANYMNGFSLYNMNEFSKYNYGVSVCLECDIFQVLANKIDIGIYGRSSFQNFVPSNLQLEKLHSYSFSNGLYSEFLLPQNISISYSLGAGFLISDIYFVSGQKGTIEDIYYDFMIESDLQIRKLFLSFNKANILLTSGCHFAFYNEKSNSFCTIGPTFGLMLNFKESKVLSKGINR